MDNSRMNRFNFWMFGMMIIGFMLEYQGFNFGLKYLTNSMTTWIQVICQSMEVMMGEFSWYLWAAPVLWTILMIVSVKGRSLLYRLYPEDAI